jgi:hypothetical protein
MQNDKEEIVACEVKLTSSPSLHHLKVLKKLNEKYGDRFKRGIVFYTGADAIYPSDKMSFVPASILWRA